MNPLAVSPSEGARLAGVGRTKFYEALGRGEIASFKFGARRLIRVAAIEDWLRRREALAREGR
ncbi:MAG: DNA-binding protein [Alphaproteobacteria bacterium]|nr:MAG: DNA-binding protein [Alphaproteobacteria bacterium]